jgi:hypothetical protein
VIFPLVAVQAPPSFTFDVESGKGLVVFARGIPLINGSGVQFFQPGWTKGYYSTTGTSQRIERLDLHTLKESFTSDDGLAQGAITYHADQDHLQVHYDLLWSGDQAADAEVTAGLLWAPAYENGTLTADGKPTRSLAVTSYKSDDVGERRFSGDASTYAFSAPVGAASVTSTIPLTLFDGRGSADDWAKNHDYLWFGGLALPLEKAKHLEFNVDYQFSLSLNDQGRSMSAGLQTRPNSVALIPDSSPPPLIPKPQIAQLDWKHPLVYKNSLKFPAGVFDHVDVFKDALARRFAVPTANAAPKIAFDGGVSKLGLVPGGYKITITPTSISVLGEEDEGLRNGLQRLASLPFVSNGNICFPTGYLRDQPHTKFRGVHLFVGKQALAFHKKLWTRVLGPLGFNKVVLQCERTGWDSTPGIETAMTMPKADLVSLFSMYREMGVDPIPLIESFGHMQWFFANGKNLDLAVDPSHPYAIDPRNPKALAALTKLWDEAISTLHPDVLHFGLDEFDLVGKHLTPDEKTQMWSALMGTLEKISKSHHAQMMLWGDQALAPGDAPDAALAETEKDAIDRRNAIPKGALIGDWHYIADANPSTYAKTLTTWKDAALQPIATTWNRPDNIAGFDVEAGRLGCGTLETTWCGYESSENSLLSAFDQFSSMVLAADYSWSGRTDPPSKLGYDPAAVFRKMYFGVPSALVSMPGTDLVLPGPASGPLEIGSIRYGSSGRLLMPGALSPNGIEIDGVALATNVRATKLAIALNSLVRPPSDGVPVGEIVVAFQNGKQIHQRLVYGVNIRKADDAQPLLFADRDTAGVCSLIIDVSAESSPIRMIAIKSQNHFTGMEIRAIEAI